MMRAPGNEDPRSSFVVPILYSELFSERPTRAQLSEHLATLDWRHVVMFSIGINCISWRRGIEDTAQQQQLAAEMLRSLIYGPHLINVMAQEPHRKLFTREGLFGLLKAAVENQHVLEGGNPAAQDAFVKAILMANELVADELLPIEATHSPADLTKSEVRSEVLQLQNLHDLLARTDAFFRWAETSEAQASPNYLSIEPDMARFTGLSWLEYAAAAYSLVSRYTGLDTWNKVERDGIAFDPDLWLGSVHDRRSIDKWLDFSQIPLQELASTWREQPSLSLASAGPLWRRPVVRVEEHLIFVPSLHLLINSVGDGVYFALFDSYGLETGDDTLKLRFSRFHGEFFQSYVTTLVTRGYEGRPDASVYPELSYAGGRSTDVIIAEGDDIIFVEVVAKRMKLVDSILKLDEGAILADIEAGVVKKMRELDKHIANYRAGVLLPMVPRSPSQRVFPIIVSPTGWPRVRIISDVIPQVQRDEHLLENTEPLELIDVEELESIERDLAAGLRLSLLLDRKNRSAPQNRMMSLNNYLYYMEPHTARSCASAAHERGNAIAREIVALATSWLQR